MSKNQLVTFFDRYADHKGFSQNCTMVDNRRFGSYFPVVLEPYVGHINEKLYLRINQDDLVDDEIQGPVRNFEISDIRFDPDALIDSLSERFMADPNTQSRYRLIQMVVDISDDAEAPLGMAHANLIYVDIVKKQVVRFEPLADQDYNGPINTVLEWYFEEMLPGYDYIMLNEHPQPEKSNGLCGDITKMSSAYVLKKSMLLVTGNEHEMSPSTPDEVQMETIKLLRFTHAIELDYGSIQSKEASPKRFSPASPKTVSARNYQSNLEKRYGMSSAGKEYGLFSPSTWKRSTQTGVAGAALGLGAGYLLGGGLTGALLGATAGGLGGFLLGKKGSDQQPQPQQQYYQQAPIQQQRYPGQYIPQQQPQYYQPQQQSQGWF